MFLVLIESNTINDKLKSLELSTIQSEEDPNVSLICSNISVPSTATKLIGDLNFKYNCSLKQ